DFVKSADPFKVKTGERTLAKGEVSLNNETVNMTVPPSAEIIQIVDHTIVDEAKEQAGKKKRRRVIFEELLVKRLWDDAAAATGVVPTTGSKGPTALKRIELQNEPCGVGSSSVPPPIEEFVSSSVTPTPEFDIPEGYGSSHDGGVLTRHASMGIVMSSSSGPDDEAAAPRVEDIAADSARGVGALGNNVEASTSGLDAASPIDDFYDSQTVETAIALLRNLSLDAFLDGFNINSAQHTCMQRDAEIAALGTRLEKAECDAVEVVSLRGHVSELEAGVAVKSQEVNTLGTQNAELSSKVSALEYERGELKRHVIKLGGDCERLRKEAV
ncbi:hypothetical protein Tco_0029175, partial [Tanacetum coccineum]